MKIWHEGVRVEYLHGTKVRFMCPNGHKSVTDFSKGKLSRRMGEAGVKLFIKYWQERITITCKKCNQEGGGKSWLKR